MEERVILYLEAWMASLRPQELMDFFVFWMASNAFLPDQVLNAAFNSTQGFARRPSPSTCSDTLSQSRMYFSQEGIVIPYYMEKGNVTCCTTLCSAQVPLLCYLSLLL